MQDVAEVFESFGWQWKRTDGTLFIPTADDINRTIDQAIKELNESDLDDAQFETGHLIVQKRGSSFDLFVHYGKV